MSRPSTIEAISLTPIQKLLPMRAGTINRFSNRKTVPATSAAQNAARQSTVLRCGGRATASSMRAPPDVQRRQIYSHAPCGDSLRGHACRKELSSMRRVRIVDRDVHGSAIVV